MSFLGKRNLACVEGVEKAPENYATLVLATRKKFRLEQPDSSVGSVSNENHIIFYEAFLDEPIVLEGKIEVSPIKWAEAFLAWDLAEIADILCEAVFTWEEFVKRQIARSSKVLLNIKKFAVMRASKWMLNKKQDPWSYNPSEWPTPAEYEIVNRVFETFTISGGDEVVAERTFYIEEEANHSNEELGNPNESPTMNPYNYDDIDKAIQRTIDKFDYSVTFTRVIQLSNLGLLPKVGNSARVCRDLTKATIPENTDIFVDAVQFSRARWTKAYESGHLVEGAHTLFRKYYKLHHNSKTFESFDQFCPIKKLAIFRAVAWMRNLRLDMITTPTIYDFNPEDPSHNVFPSEEEIQQISNYINSKYSKSLIEVTSKVKDIELSPKSEIEAMGKPLPYLGNPHLKPIQEIAQGLFSSVWRVLDTMLGKECAVKRHSLEGWCLGLPLLLQEIKFRVRLEHANLVRYYDFWDYTSPNGGQLYVQMELCHSDLAEWLRSYNKRENSSRSILNMATQVTSGLKALHSHRIIHGGLKPSNILVTVVDSCYSWKLSDFGVTRDINSARKYRDQNTDWYSSPEMARDLNIDTKTDIYSLGLVLFEVFHYFQSDVEKYELFEELKYKYQYFKTGLNILHRMSKYDLRHDDLANCHTWLAKMLCHIPDNRPDSSEILGYLEVYEAKVIGQPQISSFSSKNLGNHKIREAAEAEALLGKKDFQLTSPEVAEILTAEYGFNPWS